MADQNSNEHRFSIISEDFIDNLICTSVIEEMFMLTKVVRVDWLGNLANYKEDDNFSLFHVVCTVTVMIFCSRCDASLVYWPFPHLHLKAFCYLCTVNAIFQ